MSLPGPREPSVSHLLQWFAPQVPLREDKGAEGMVLKDILRWGRPQRCVARALPRPALPGSVALTSGTWCVFPGKYRACPSLAHFWGILSLNAVNLGPVHLSAARRICVEKIQAWPIVSPTCQVGELWSTAGPFLRKVHSSPDQFSSLGTWLPKYQGRLVTS
jgi:hypothetical protein